MAQLAKFVRNALDESTLPESTKADIADLLKQDVRAASSSDILRVPTTEDRQAWLEDRIWSEGRAERYEIGYNYGIDAFDLSEKSFSEIIIEEIAERSERSII